MFGHVRRRRRSPEELRHEAALALAARIGTGRPASEAPRRSRPAWAAVEPTLSWYRPAAPVAPSEGPGTAPLVLRTVHLHAVRQLPPTS